jgi:hypothetical protein
MDDKQSQSPIGAPGTAANYTSDDGWAALRANEMRGRTCLNWLYHLSF